MEMTIHWSNRDTDVDEFRIYRSDSKIDPIDPPTPIATVTGDTFSYVDQDVTLGGLYHYVVTAVKGGHEAQSMSRALAAIPHTGPGPQELIYGDYEFGIFGRMPSWQLFTRDQFFAQFDTLPKYATKFRDSDEWVKYMWRGRVCFMPFKGNFLYNVAWQYLYEAGLVYGVDGPGPQSLLSAVNQRVVVTRDQYTFRVRTPQAMLLDQDVYQENHPSSRLFEWGFAIAPWMSGHLNTYWSRYHNDKENYGMLLGNETSRWVPWSSSSSTGERTIAADLVMGNQAFLTGYGRNSDGNAVLRESYNRYVSYYGWRPVLELEY